jgi:hypothetical protein
MRSVLQANGARPLTFCASAISTAQPQRSSVSCTNRAPFIDSIAADTGPPWRSSTSLANPANASPSATPRPSRPAHHRASTGSNPAAGD